MPGLHDTSRGQRLIDVTLPRIADELANVANGLAALVALLRERLPAPPPETTGTSATKRG